VLLPQPTLSQSPATAAPFSPLTQRPVRHPLPTFSPPPPRGRPRRPCSPLRGRHGQIRPSAAARARRPLGCGA
jgi:hypothetical protein